MWGCGGDSAVQPHSMGGVEGARGGTHTGTYTQMLHLPFSDLPLKKCSSSHMSNGIFIRTRQKQRWATFVENTIKRDTRPEKRDRIKNPRHDQHPERDRNEIRICIT